MGHAFLSQPPNVSFLAIGISPSTSFKHPTQACVNHFGVTKNYPSFNAPLHYIQPNATPIVVEIVLFVQLIQFRVACAKKQHFQKVCDNFAVAGTTPTPCQQAEGWDTESGDAADCCSAKWVIRSDVVQLVSEKVFEAAIVIHHASLEFPPSIAFHLDTTLRSFCVWKDSH